MARTPSPADRTCCDGLCQRSGGSCPSFAPGVQDGPYACPAQRRARLVTRCAVVLAVATLAGLAIAGALRVLDALRPMGWL